jgi:hypothetical protein
MRLEHDRPLARIILYLASPLQTKPFAVAEELREDREEVTVASATQVESRPK